MNFMEFVSKNSQEHVFEFSLSEFKGSYGEWAEKINAAYMGMVMSETLAYEKNNGACLAASIEYNEYTNNELHIGEHGMLVRRRFMVINMTTIAQFVYAHEMDMSKFLGADRRLMTQLANTFVCHAYHDADENSPFPTSDGAKRAMGEIIAQIGADKANKLAGLFAKVALIISLYRLHEADEDMRSILMDNIRLLGDHHVTNLEEAIKSNIDGQYIALETKPLPKMAKTITGRMVH